jgi:DNA-binding NtrC family response regulator
MMTKKQENWILIVDDDRTISTSLAAVLEQEGYRVETAENGAQALAKASKTHFDLALVDMRLPDMNGTDLLRLLPEGTPKMAKIIVTGYPSMQNAITSVNEGADGYLLKPVEAESVLQMIEKQLKKRAESTKYSEQKVAEYILGRARELSGKGDESKKPS